MAIPLLSSSEHWTRHQAHVNATPSFSVPAPRRRRQLRSQVDGSVRVPAYVCPLGSDDGSGKKEAAASCVMCSVCLEDLRGGEMVRELPACYVMLTVKAAATEEAPESSSESLPPV